LAAPVAAETLRREADFAARKAEIMAEAELWAGPG
jgi:hypothetical protein